MSSHHPNSSCLSTEEMLDYSRGILSPSEQHSIEKHLLDCEMCSDALEGIQMMEDPNSLFAIEQELNLEVDEMIHAKQETKVRVLFPWRMAAAIALIFVSTFVLWMVIPKNNQQELISEKTVPYPVPGDSKAVSEQEIQVANEFSSKESPIATSNSEVKIKSNDEMEENTNVSDAEIPNAPAQIAEPNTSNEETSDESSSSSPSEDIAFAKKKENKNIEVDAGIALSEVTSTKSTSRSKASQSQNAATTATSRDDKKEIVEKENPEEAIFNQGIKDYQNKKYLKAIQSFELCKVKPEALFYSGVSYFLLENPHTALEKLGNYLQSTHATYKEAATWYSGLSYLNIDNKTAAKQAFEKVILLDGEFKKDALEMLKNL